MLTAVTERVGSMVRFNESFLNFLRQFSITPVACNIRAPHEKGWKAVLNICDTIFGRSRSLPIWMMSTIRSWHGLNVENKYYLSIFRIIFLSFGRWFLQMSKMISSSINYFLLNTFEKVTFTQVTFPDNFYSPLKFFFHIYLQAS